MKEDIRGIFRQWCKDMKLIVTPQDEALLIDEIFLVVKERLR